MGLLKAGIGAVKTVFADQWKEYFYCDSIPANILAVKGQKRIGAGSSNTSGTDNIISNGSVIAVADGQCMIIVDQGKVVEVCAEPGEFTYDTSTEPSIFAGSLGKSIVDTFKTIGKRFTYGGDTGKDQRVYYFNTKEILDNKFGTVEPIPFSINESRINLFLETAVRCSGRYSYKITNPLLFYTNVCGNVESAYSRSNLDETLKTEFITALMPSIGGLSALNILPSAIPAHTKEIIDAINSELDAQWSEMRGIEVVSIAFNPITLPPADAEIIKKAQQTAFLSNPNMAAATLVGAQAEAMKTAAANENGAMMGFMGMNMANQAGGMNAQSLFQMGAQQQAQPQQPVQPQQPAADAWNCVCGASNTGKFCINCGKGKPAPADVWKCSCGAENKGKFCVECGSPKPEKQEGWSCSCGAVNKGKFCMECGKPKPAGAPLYRCDKCGWEPEDPNNPPKFCPECADPFNDDDIVK